MGTLLSANQQYSDGNTPTQEYFDGNTANPQYSDGNTALLLE